MISITNHSVKNESKEVNRAKSQELWNEPHKKLEEYFKKRHEEEEKQERELKRSKAKDGEHDNGSEVIEEMSLKTDVEQKVQVKISDKVEGFKEAEATLIVTDTNEYNSLTEKKTLDNCMGNLHSQEENKLSNLSEIAAALDSEKVDSVFKSLNETRSEEKRQSEDLANDPTTNEIKTFESSYQEIKVQEIEVSTTIESHNECLTSILTKSNNLNLSQTTSELQVELNEVALEISRDTNTTESKGNQISETNNLPEKSSTDTLKESSKKSNSSPKNVLNTDTAKNSQEFTEITVTATTIELKEKSSVINKVPDSLLPPECNDNMYSLHAEQKEIVAVSNSKIPSNQDLAHPPTTCCTIL